MVITLKKSTSWAETTHRVIIVGDVVANPPFPLGVCHDLFKGPQCSRIKLFEKIGSFSYKQKIFERKKKITLNIV